MPIHADNSPNIKWPLPEGKPAFFIDEVFPPDMLEVVKNTINEQANWGPGSEKLENSPRYHNIMGRWHTEVDFPQEVWDYIENLGRTRWEKPDLKLKVIWVARYQQYKGITPYIWEHMDQPATQFTADICIESHGVDSWGLEIDGQRFEEYPNSGAFFMGQQQVHKRPPYPVDDESAYLTLLFANFASPEHWIYDIDAYSLDEYEKLRGLMAHYKLDGDVRYYEHMGHAPFFNDLPAGNKECPGCTECNVVTENFIDDIEGYTHLA